MTAAPSAIRRVPVENLYYLLCYACGRAPGTGEAKIDPKSCPDALNLLAMALARSLRSLARRGLERNYIVEGEVTPRLRGRILVAFASTATIAPIACRLQCVACSTAS